NRSDLRTNHTITLTNLRPETRYYLAVTSRGRHANATTDTDGGADYQFDTSAIGDVLVVVGGSSFPPEREASYAAALASNGWSGSFWRVAELGLPPLAVLRAPSRWRGRRRTDDESRGRLLERDVDRRQSGHRMHSLASADRPALGVLVPEWDRRARDLGRDAVASRILRVRNHGNRFDHGE